MSVNHTYFDQNKSLELKGVAIILMLFHHCFRLREIFNDYAISFFPFSESSIVDTAYASKICVSMFAFITGYGLYIRYSTKDESAQKWAAKRYIKTFSGYWFVWFVCAIAFQIISKRTTNLFFDGEIDRGIVYCVLNITGLDIIFGTPTLNMVWWYMGAAAVFIVSMPVIYKFRENIWLFLAMAILLSRTVLGHDGDVLTSSGMSPFAFFVPMIMGCAFARYAIFEKIHSMTPTIKFYLFVVEVWAIVFFYKIYLHLDREKLWEIHYGLFPIICIMFIIEYLLSVKCFEKPLAFLGKHSLNMYLIHPFIIEYLEPVIFSCNHFILTVLVLIALSLTASLIIEFVKQITKYNITIERLLKLI